MWKLGSFLAKFMWSIATGLYRGWGLTVLWGWFIVGFMGIPAMPIWVGIGFSFVAAYLFTSITDVYVALQAADKVPQNIQTATVWLSSPLLTSFFLLGGWIWTVLRPFLGI